MNGGGKHNQCLRMECVFLGADVVGVLSPISLTDNSLNKWKQVKCYLISVKYYCTHTPHCEALLRSERRTFSEAVTPSFENVLTVNWSNTKKKFSGFLFLCFNSLPKRQDSLLLFNSRSFLNVFLQFPVYLNGPIPIFQPAQLSGWAFKRLKSCDFFQAYKSNFEFQS